MEHLRKAAVAAMMLAVAADPLTIFAVGDWGGQTVSTDTATSQTAVAKAMALAAAQRAPAFVINVGDNFYDLGVNSTDDPLWKTDFENIYTASGLQVPWYSILGNHDYASNPGAQTQYTGDKRWVMPNRYYSHRVPEHNLSLIFLDTNPCLQAYRGSDPTGWDPNTPQFNPNILSQDCLAQAKWLESQLSSAPAGDFVWVVGHHPIFDVDVFDIFPIFEQYKVDFYLCGHRHKLEHYRVDQSPLDHVISGAGCRVKIAAAQEEEERKLQPVPVHNVTDVWDKKLAGFTIHTLSADASSLTTEFIDYQGNVHHQIVSNRR